MNRIDIINKLIEKKGYKSYLEIGVQNGASFNQVKCKDKVGVDPDINVKQYVNDCLIMTSDDFFAQNKRNFDIVFIDGLHEFKQVYTDIINALKILNKGGTIVCHDMLPPDELHQRVPRPQPSWTGDGWKAWVILRGTRSDLQMYVVDTDYGCGVIQRGQQELISYGKLTYDWFVRNREKMRIISGEDFNLIF
jgi:predicted O-methyltransferase YrrM